MADGNAIEILTKYRRGRAGDPAENRLTAALAALLLESAELRNRLAGHYLAGDWEPEETLVRTQRRIGGGKGWVDLELDVRKPRRAMVWIEVKYGSRLSGGEQLSKYVDALRKFQIRGARQLVLLLVPESERGGFRGIEDWPGAESALDLVPYVTSWQDLCACLSKAPKASAEQAQSDSAWLHREVLEYITAKLESLEARSARGRALRALDPANQEMRSLNSDVRHALESNGWHGRGGFSHGPWWEWFEPRLPAERRNRSHAFLEFRIEPPYLFAGVRFVTDGGGPVTPAGDSAWASALLATTSVPHEADPWQERDEEHSDHTCLFCRRALAAVIGNAPTDERARAITTFVESAFRIAMATRKTSNDTA